MKSRGMKQPRYVARMMEKRNAENCLSLNMTAQLFVFLALQPIMFVFLQPDSGL
jgi:hypothetical protein